MEIFVHISRTNSIHIVIRHAIGTPSVLYIQPFVILD